ncbi:MAG: DUF3098 domain-containing protein [candidate division Zixibacteria bacterium]|nr:DUF3098 domain-containing protein [candidate division Zixibacteria bacterium]
MMARKLSKNEESLGFGKLNYVLMAVGLGMIVLGYILLAVGDITGAPILLVIGYCAVLPTAILISQRSKQGSAGTDPSIEK